MDLAKRISQQFLPQRASPIQPERSLTWILCSTLSFQKDGPGPDSPTGTTLKPLALDPAQVNPSPQTMDKKLSDSLDFILHCPFHLGIVKIMVPIWVPIIMRGLIRGPNLRDPKGTIILTITHLVVRDLATCS